MATQTFAVGVLKHLESTFFAPLEKENAKLSELRKVLVSLLQFFSDPNLGYRRLLCLDVVANFPRDETGNQWQHIIEQVLFALTKEVEQLGKKKARVHLPSFNIFHKILHLCEERNPGYFLERIAKKLFDHVHFALSRCLCTESKYVEIVTVYERILTLLMKSPLYCKAFKWDLLKKFILFCFGDDGRVDQMTTDLLRIVVTSFTYDYEAKNMFGDTEEYDGDLNSIFYQISFAFKSIILPGRTSGESADTIADIAKNLLCVLNVLMEKCGLNVVSALYRWGHTSFQYALASMTDSLPVLRDESLRYLQNHMRLLRENTKWYGLTNMKKYSITENISNMYEVLVETNILTKFLSQAGSPHVMDGSGKIEFDRATTSSTPLERHARLAADIFFCIDLTSKEVPDGIADKDDWVERYCRVAGGSPLESEGKTDSSGSGDFLSPNLRRKRGASSPSLWSNNKRRKTDTILDAMTTRRHVLETMNDLISDTSRKHYSIFFVMVRVFEFYPDWVLCRRVQDRAKGKSHHSLAWLLAFTTKGFELMHALQSDHPSFVLLLSCLHRSLFILKHAENTTSLRELPKQRQHVHEIRSVWRSSLDLFVGKLHRITAAGYASSAGRDLLCLTVAHGLRTGYIEPKNHDVVWQLPFEKGIFHNIHALAMVFASLSCPNFSTSVDHMVRVKLLKYVLSCAEVLLLGENCDGTQEREEIAPENVQYTYFVAAVMCSLFSSDCSVVNLATISDREEEEINIDKEKIVNGAAHDVHIETKVSVDKIIFDVTQSWWTKTGGLSAAYSSAESSIKMQQEMHRTIFSWLTVHVPEETLASHEHSKLIKCICASYFGAAWLQTAFSIPACAHLITAEYVGVVAKLVHVVVCAINSGCLSVDVFIQHRANILHKVAANVIEALCVRLGRLGNACAIAKCFQDIKQELLIALSHDVKQTALRYRDFQTSVKTYFAYCSDLSSTSSVDQPKHDDDDFRVESASSSVHDSRNSFATASERIDDDNRILAVGSSHLSNVYESWPMVDGPKYFGIDDYLYFHETAIQWFLHRYSIVVLHYLKTAPTKCVSQVEILVDEMIQAVVHEPNWKRGSHFFFLCAKYLNFLYQRRKGGPNSEEIYQTILTDMAEAFVLGRKKSLVYINDNNSRVFFWTVLEIFKCLNITVHEARCNVLFRSLVDIISTMNLVHSSRDSVHSPKLLPRDVRLTSQFFCAQLLELRADCNEDLFEAIMAQVEDWLQDEDYYVRCASGETYSLLLNGRSIDDKIVIYEDYESKFRLSSGSPKLEFQTYVLGSLSIGMKCNELIPRVLSSLVDFCADNEWGKHLGIYCLTVLARSCLKEEIEFRAPYALLTEHMRFVLGTWVRADFQRPVSELRRFPFSVFYPSHVFNSIESFIRRFMHFVVAEIVVQGSATQADTREGIHSSLETLSSKRLMLLSSLEEFVEPTNWKGTSGLLRQYFGSIYAFSRSFTYLPDPSIEDDGDSIERIKPGEIANYVDKFLLGALEKKIYYTYAFMNRCEIVPWLLLLDPSVVASPVNLDDYGEQNPPKLIRDAKQYIFDKIKSNPEGGGPVLLKVVSSIDVLAFLYTFATCSHDLRTFSLVSKALRVYVNCSSPEVLDDLFITLILSLAWFLCDKSASCWFDCCCIVSRYIEKHLVSRAPEGKIFLEKKMNLFMRIMLLPFLCPREVILKQIDLREYTQVKNMASKGMNSLFASRRRGSLRDAIRRIPDLPKIEELQALVSRKSQERSTLTNTIRYFMTSVNDVFFNTGLGVYYSHYVLSNISDFAETSLSTLSAEAVNTSSCCFEDDIVAARVDMDTNILTPYSGRDNQVGNTDSGLVSRFTEAVIEICNCPSVSPSIHKIASACLGVLEQGGGGWYASHGLGEYTLLSSDLANTAVARSKILAKCLVDRVKQSSCRGSAFAACFSGKRDLEITEKTSRGNLSITLREIVRDDFQEAKRTFELGEHLWHCGDTPFPIFVTRLAYMCVTQYIPEDSFRNCAAACLLDPCFAEAIFPLIILTSLRNSREAPSVASNLHSMVMQERYIKKKAVLVIRTLDYLRKQGLQEHQHKVTSRPFATKQVDYSPSIELSEATVISFLDVAKLAYEHNMNSLALLYTELFDKNIKTRRGPNHVVTIDSLHKLAEHESLLFSIYKRLNSADSLSGSSHKSLSSLLSFDEKNFLKPIEASVAREQMEWQPIFDTLRRGDLGLCKILIDNERDRVLYAMKHASIFEMKNRSRHIQALCVLDQVACVSSGGDSDQKRVDVLLQQWGARIFRSIHETEGGFNAIEPLLKQRGKILRALKKDDMYFSHVLHTAIVARQSKQLDAAEATIMQLKRVNDMQFSSLEKQIRVAIEESLLMAAKGQLSDGILFAGKIKDILQNVKPRDKTLLLSYKSNLLRTLGKWTAVMRSESSDEILDKYFLGAVKFAGRKDEEVAASFAAGKYMNTLYLALLDRMNSPEWEELNRDREQTRKEWHQLKEVKPSATESRSDLKKRRNHLRYLKHILDQDDREVEKLKYNMTEYLFGAAKRYIFCLSNMNVEGIAKNEMSMVVRLLDILFKNPDNMDLQKIMQDSIDRMNMNAFLPFVQQITSRITDDVDCGPLIRTLEALLVQMLVKAPDHCLPPLLLLRGSSGPSDLPCDRARSKFSRCVLKQYRTLRPDDGQARVDSYINIIEAFSKLALWVPEGGWDIFNERKEKVGTKKGKKIQCSIVPGWDEAIRRAGLERGFVPIWTDGANRNNTLHSLDPYFKASSSGLSVPKIIKCHDHCGESYKQYLKGGDDLRQDEVMEQVFRLVNTLLHQDQRCRQRQLQIRTYKVVPFSNSVGLIEHVQNSTSLKEYLTAAHKKWHPTERTPHDVFETLADAYKMGLKEKERVKIFQTECRRFNPAMYDEMVSRISDTDNWYKQRLAYTRSVAVNSVIGYIIGLGDRHVSNVMIDETTHELVHIDFGVAFEQGKCLPCPEKVPFRLSRDLVNGMGVSGYEGVFQRCSEETLRVLKSHQDALLFVFDAFLHNPLCDWKVSGVDWMKKNGVLIDEEDENVQLEKDGHGASGVIDLCDEAATEHVNSVNKLAEKNRRAERAIGRIRQKLNGYHDGNLMGVEGHIKSLINEATDFRNLGTIFPGWNPHL
jgi:hypothetical protein